jgi:F0F1-type ATP synthase membrane subunit c/vacuolar-type H+-ATPase subunit K
MNQPLATHFRGSVREFNSNEFRETLREYWPEWITLTCYAALIAFAIPFHEPWADEAQAWQLARSLPLHTLFHTYLRYEGSPGLWHFLLWFLIRAHVSYAGMHWICGAIALTGITLLVLYSPFPRYLRLSLPFTYFLLFQYAIVARNYVLVPLLMFLLAIRWKRGPLGVALLLGLLANVALHVAVISAGLALVYLIEQMRTGITKQPRLRGQFILGAGVVLGFYLFALWTAWPPHDVVFARVRGPSRPFLPFAIISLCWGVCQPWVLGIPVWVVTAVYLHHKGSLYYLLPVLFYVIFSGAIFVAYWHAGLLIPLLICILWMTWSASWKSTPQYELLGRIALLYVIAIQILWASYAIAYDHARAFSPDLAASKFLKPFVDSGSTVAVTYANEPPGNQSFDAVGILPYFQHNIYSNQPLPFWWWSPNNPTKNNFLQVLHLRPQLVLVETRKYEKGQVVNWNDSTMKLLLRDNYTLTNIFCGAIPLRLRPGFSTCHLIFQYTGSDAGLAEPDRTSHHFTQP